MGVLLPFVKTESTEQISRIKTMADEVSKLADQGKWDGIIIGGLKDGKIVCERTVGADKFSIWAFAERLLTRVSK